MERHKAQYGAIEALAPSPGEKQGYFLYILTRGGQQALLAHFGEAAECSISMFV